MGINGLTPGVPETTPASGVSSPFVASEQPAQQMPKIGRSESSVQKFLIFIECDAASNPVAHCLHVLQDGGVGRIRRATRRHGAFEEGSER
jgi:hypothetical protein